MTWWAWALVIWALLASVTAIALAVRLSLYVEWREAMLTAQDGAWKDEVEPVQRFRLGAGLFGHRRTAVLEMAGTVYRRVHVKRRR